MNTYNSTYNLPYGLKQTGQHDNITKYKHNNTINLQSDTYIHYSKTFCYICKLTRSVTYIWYMYRFDEWYYPNTRVQLNIHFGWYVLIHIWSVGLPQWIWLLFICLLCNSWFSHAPSSTYRYDRLLWLFIVGLTECYNCLGVTGPVCNATITCAVDQVSFINSRDA